MICTCEVDVDAIDDFAQMEKRSVLVFVAPVLLKSITRTRTRLCAAAKLEHGAHPLQV